MKEWLFSVVGVVFLGVLFDLIYPSGKTNKFCKGIFGIIACFIMISPIIKLKDMEISNDFTDTTLVDNINNSKEEVLQYQIIEHLKDKGYDGVNTEVVGKMSNNVFEIENIYIDITNIVLSKDMENINIYEVIINEVSEKFGIDSKRVVVYG